MASAAILVRQRHDVDRVANADAAALDHPAVQGERAIELAADVAEDVEVLLAGVRVDGRDDASRAKRADAVHRIRYSQGAARQVAFGPCVRAGYHDVWT